MSLALFRAAFPPAPQRAMFMAGALPCRLGAAAVAFFLNWKRQG